MRQLKNTTRTKLILLLIVLLIPVIFTGCQSYARDFEQVSDDEKIIIRFSHVVGEDTPKGQAARRFSKLIKERSLGKIEVQVFANGSLYRDGEEWDALQDGKLQIIAPAMAKLTSKIPELQIFDLPFFFTDIEEIHHMTDGKIGEIIFQSANEHNVVPLAIWDNGFKHFTNNRNPLRQPEDFIGLNFRIMPSLILEEQFTLLEAGAEVRNFNDVYRALVNQEIDGQENTISNIYTKKFYEVQNYLTLSNHGYLGYLVIINEDFWNKLSPEYQTIIIDAMNDVTEWQRIKAQELQKQQLQLIKDSNSIQIDTLTEEERQILKELYLPLYKKLEQNLGTSFTQEMKTLK